MEQLSWNYRRVDMNIEFERGDQVAYVPTHAHKDIDHPHAETGFVTSLRDDFAFVRYWMKGREGADLRTTGNSEGTPIDNLRLLPRTDPRHVDLGIVEKLLETM